MKKIILASAMSGVVLLLGACATTPKNTLAIQKENNQFEVTGIGKTNLIAKNNAVTAAQKHALRAQRQLLLMKNVLPWGLKRCGK